MTSPVSAVEAIEKAIMAAIVSCAHEIDRGSVVLRFSERQSGHNAYNQLHRRVHDALLVALARQAEALKRENAELREGLKPFAECAPEWEGEPDSLHVFFEWNDESAPVPSLPVADFRRARTLLKEEANADN